MHSTTRKYLKYLSLLIGKASALFDIKLALSSFTKASTQMNSTVLVSSSRITAMISSLLLHNEMLIRVSSYQGIVRQGRLRSVRTKGTNALAYKDCCD